MSDDESNEPEDGSIDDISTSVTKLRKRGLNWPGIAATVAYMLAVYVYLASADTSPMTLKPNEMGDFLAGAFAPLAFLWLVLGYYQQGTELRNSADALHLQIVELRGSVEQQKGLVQATKDLRQSDAEIHRVQMVELERASLPVINFTAAGGMTIGGINGTEYMFSFKVSNGGRTCTNFEVRLGNTLLKFIGALEAGAANQIEVQAMLREQKSHEIDVSYIDARNIPRIEQWLLETGPVRDARLMSKSALLQ